MLIRLFSDASSSHCSNRQKSLLILRIRRCFSSHQQQDGGTNISSSDDSLETQRRRSRTLASSIFGRATEQNFHPADLVARRYRWDRLSPEQWLLVYNSRFNTFVLHMGHYGWAVALVMVAMAVDDFWRRGQGQGFTRPELRLRHSQWITHGWFMYVTLVPMALVLLSLFRISRFQLCRIYVDRAEPNRLCARIPRGLFGTKLVELDRSDVRGPKRNVLRLRYESGLRDPLAFCGWLADFFLNGQLRLGRFGPVMLNEHGFRSHRFQNWITNEPGAAVPKAELSALDRDLERAAAVERAAPGRRRWKRLLDYLERRYYSRERL